MKKSKTRLSFLKWVFFLGIVLFLSYTRTSENKLNDQESNVTVTGIVMKITTKEEKTTLEIKEKEPFVVYINQKRKLRLGDKVMVTGTKSKIKDSGVFNLFRYDLYMKSNYKL